MAMKIYFNEIKSQEYGWERITNVIWEIFYFKYRSHSITYVSKIFKFLQTLSIFSKALEKIIFQVIRIALELFQTWGLIRTSIPYPNRIFISSFPIKFVANKTCRIFFETISLKVDISWCRERKSECVLYTFPFVGATISMLHSLPEKREGRMHLLVSSHRVVVDPFKKNTH